MYKQLIIARRDLNMSPGKLAAQVSHASMAFLITAIKNFAEQVYTNRYLSTDPNTGELIPYRHGDLAQLAKEAFKKGRLYFYADPVDPKNPYGKLKSSNAETRYSCFLSLDEQLYQSWIDESMTKVVCGARDKSRLLKAIEKAKALGMKEGEDYFLIYDACRTELEPEEENGGTLTCIGFKPMPAEIIDQIGKEYHLY